MLFLFDLDGTLITSYMDNKDKDYHLWSAIPGRIDKIADLQYEGHEIGIVTNQAGVGFGFITPIDFYNKMDEVSSIFGVNAGYFWFCFAHPKAEPPNNDPVELERRKPNPGMLYEAMEFFGYQIDDTVMVGDMETDRMAAHAAGVRYYDAEEFFSS